MESPIRVRPDPVGPSRPITRPGYTGRPAAAAGAGDAPGAAVWMVTAMLPAFRPVRSLSLLRPGEGE